MKIEVNRIEFSSGNIQYRIRMDGCDIGSGETKESALQNAFTGLEIAQSDVWRMLQIAEKEAENG